MTVYKVSSAAPSVPSARIVSWGESSVGIEFIRYFGAFRLAGWLQRGEIMRGIRAAICATLLSALAAPAAAVTTDQVVALKKAGVSDAVVLALIERDHTVFSIAPEQIVALQREGLSEALIIAMLKSGQDADDAARAESAYASAIVAAAIPPGPEILIVGHGPERPNTYHRDGFFTNNPSPYLFPSYRRSFAYDVPYLPHEDKGYLAPRLSTRGDRYRQPRALCYAQMSSSASGANSLTYVTECPPVLQPSRRLR